MTESAPLDKKATRRRGISSFEKLVPAKRPTGKFHPLTTERWYKNTDLHRLESSQVTADSDAIVFAWEFLRRNRYYMSLADKKYLQIPAREWGFQWNKKVDRTHGLMELKHYSEHFHEGRQPRWTGLDSFAQALQQQQTSSETKNIQLEIRPGQLAVLIDLGNVFHASPWRQQIFALQDYLENFSKADHEIEEAKGKTLHKSILLRRLRTLDAFTKGATAREAGKLASSLQTRELIAQNPKVASPFGHMTDTLPTKPTCYEDLSEAYNLVYQHGYLKLAIQDGLYKIDGERMRPYSYEEIMGEEQKLKTRLEDLKSVTHKI